MDRYGDLFAKQVETEWIAKCFFVVVLVLVGLMASSGCRLGKMNLVLPRLQDDPTSKTLLDTPGVKTKIKKRKYLKKRSNKF